MIGLVDVGGTKLLAAASTDAGVPGRSVRRHTPHGGDVAGVLAEMLDEVRGGQRLDAVGAAVPGPFDRRRGRLVNPPGMPAPWHGLDLAGVLGQRFDCPVLLENDANCAALAEAHLGAGRGAHLLVYYTVSTGIGSGIVRDGHLVVEREDSEGGHQVLWPARLGGPACDCGGAGCLEALASGRAIEKRFGCPAEQVEDQAVWDEVGEWLGLAAVNATALLDCDRVVFGGGVAGARWSRIASSLTAVVGRQLRLQAPPDIRPAELGEDRNLAGALLLVEGRSR